MRNTVGGTQVDYNKLVQTVWPGVAMDVAEH